MQPSSFDMTRIAAVDDGPGDAGEGSPAGGHGISSRLIPSHGCIDGLAPPFVTKTLRIFASTLSHDSSPVFTHVDSTPNAAPLTTPTSDHDRSDARANSVRSLT